jgi:hypothetical protein
MRPKSTFVNLALSSPAVDSLLVCLGFALILAGLVSLIRPLRFLYIRTRLAAAMVMAAGACLEFVAGGMLDSYLVYLGLTLFLAGLVSFLRPLSFLGIRTRRVGAGVAAGGFVLFLVALLLPVSENTATAHTAKLDDWMPQWQIRERHITSIGAPPEKVFAAIHAVRADDIFLFRTLIAIRQCGQPGQESIMNAPEQKPILDVATQTTFVLLTEEPPRELVIGTVVAAPPQAPASRRLTPELFQTKLQPGVALATMNFLVTPDDHGGSIVSTETRIYANNRAAARRFAIYWRIIHPGSDIMRRMWLRAIKQRAEGAIPPGIAG